MLGQEVKPQLTSDQNSQTFPSGPSKDQLRAELAQANKAKNTSDFIRLPAGGEVMVEGVGTVRRDADGSVIVDGRRIVLGLEASDGAVARLNQLIFRHHDGEWHVARLSPGGVTVRDSVVSAPRGAIDQVRGLTVENSRVISTDPSSSSRGGGILNHGVIGEVTHFDDSAPHTSGPITTPGPVPGTRGHVINAEGGIIGKVNPTQRNDVAPESNGRGIPIRDSVIYAPRGAIDQVRGLTIENSKVISTDPFSSSGGGRILNHGVIGEVTHFDDSAPHTSGPITTPGPVPGTRGHVINAEGGIVGQVNPPQKNDVASQGERRGVIIRDSVLDAPPSATREIRGVTLENTKVAPTNAPSADGSRRVYGPYTGNGPVPGTHGAVINTGGTVGRVNQYGTPKGVEASSPTTSGSRSTSGVISDSTTSNVAPQASSLNEIAERLVTKNLVKANDAKLVLGKASAEAAGDVRIDDHQARLSLACIVAFGSEASEAFRSGGYAKLVADGWVEKVWDKPSYKQVYGL